MKLTFAPTTKILPYNLIRPGQVFKDTNNKFYMKIPTRYKDNPDSCMLLISDQEPVLYTQHDLDEKFEVYDIEIIIKPKS